MENAVLTIPEIGDAIRELGRLLAPVRSSIKSVELFGSTVKMALVDAKDIDFFIGFEGSTFDEVRDQLLSAKVGRRVVVESVEGNYANHPTWPRETPLAIHVVLFRKGITQFSEKLERTRRDSIQIPENMWRAT